MSSWWAGWSGSTRSPSSWCWRGAAIAGIAGAIVAVPITVALVRAWPYLQGRTPAPSASGHADQPQRR